MSIMRPNKHASVPTIPVRNFVMFMFFSAFVQISEYSEAYEEKLGLRVEQVQYKFVMFQLYTN